ncbi:Uncharacterized protein Rs2_00780 [Raphanus sativus]|nr:Uncharacterized protein Rs2_00780 [Raphanus sativus]
MSQEPLGMWLTESLLLSKLYIWWCAAVNIDKAFESPHTHSNCFTYLSHFPKLLSDIQRVVYPTHRCGKVKAQGSGNLDKTMESLFSFSVRLFEMFGSFLARKKKGQALCREPQALDIGAHEILHSIQAFTRCRMCTLQLTCLATLANMVAHTHHLSAYASARLLHSIKISLSRADDSVSEDLIVYAIMHRQEVFRPFKNHPRFHELAENIYTVGSITVPEYLIDPSTYFNSLKDRIENGQCRKFSSSSFTIVGLGEAKE